MRFQPRILRRFVWALSVALIGTLLAVALSSAKDFPQRASVTYLEDLDGDGHPELLVVDEAADSGPATPSFGIYGLESGAVLALGKTVEHFRMAEPLFSASAVKTSGGFAVHHQHHGRDWVTSFGLTDAAIQWQTSLPGEAMVEGTLPWRLVMVEDLLLAVSRGRPDQRVNHHQPTVAVTRLDPRTGERLWTRTLSRGVVGFVPIAAERNILFSESKRMCVLLGAVDGRIAKRLACEGVVLAPKGDAVYGARRGPEFGQDRTVLTQFNPSDQVFVPVIRGAGVVQLAGPGLAISADGQTLVSHDGRRRMWAHDLRTGTRQWSLDIGADETFKLPIRSWRHPHRSPWHVLHGRYAPLKLYSSQGSGWRLVALDIERGKLQASTGDEASVCSLVGVVATGQWVLFGVTQGQRQTLAVFDTQTGTIIAELGSQEGVAGLILPAEMSPAMVYGPYVSLSGVRGTTVVRLDGTESRVVFDSHPGLFGVRDFHGASGTLQLRPLASAAGPAERR